MTLREHLDELRRRLMFVVVFVVLAMIVAFVFRDPVLRFLLEPGFGDVGGMPIATEVLETISVTFKVTLLVGFVASLPVVLYQVIMFVSPGLTRRERGYLFLLLPGVLVAFGAGVAFAYYILLPPALGFLFVFQGDLVDIQPRIASYINLITTLMFWMGVVFQIPIVTFTLARFGVVTPRWLGRFRRVAVVLAFVAAAIITPTFDPVNQTLVAVPIIVLYEFGVVLARLGQRLRRRSEPREASAAPARRLGRLRFWDRGGAE